MCFWGVISKMLFLNLFKLWVWCWALFYKRCVCPICLPHRCGRTWCHSPVLGGLQWSCFFGLVRKHCRKPNSCDEYCVGLVGHLLPWVVSHAALDEESVLPPRYLTGEHLWEKRLAPETLWWVRALLVLYEHHLNWFAARCDAQSHYLQPWCSIQV